MQGSKLICMIFYRVLIRNMLSTIMPSNKRRCVVKIMERMQMRDLAIQIIMMEQVYISIYIDAACNKQEACPAGLLRKKARRYCIWVQKKRALPFLLKFLQYSWHYSWQKNRDGRRYGFIPTPSLQSKLQKSSLDNQVSSPTYIREAMSMYLVKQKQYLGCA